MAFRFVLLLLVTLPLAAGAQSTSASYEAELIAWALKEHGRTLEPQPEGKPLEEVLISIEDVFAERDPWPNFLNWFHVRSKERIVQQEVLVQPGQPWNARLVAETERNLRRLFVFAVARTVAVKGKNGGVALLVVTKDRWSLRLNSDYLLVGNLLQYLLLQPTEQNLFGNNQQLLLNYTLRLDQYSIGETFQERRLFGTKLYFGEAAALVFNRNTHQLEGTTGEVVFGRPIVSLAQEWAFLVNPVWNVRKRRTFRGPRVWQLEYPGGGTVPFIYDQRELSAEASVTRSINLTKPPEEGQRTGFWKLDLTGAVGGYAREYTPARESELSDEQAEWFRSNYLPLTERATYLSAHARLFEARYEVLKGIDTFELSEDYQLGLSTQLGVRGAIPAISGTVGYVESGASIRWRTHRHQDLFTFTIAGAARAQGGQLINQRIAFEMLNYSPPFEGGRFVTRVIGDFKFNDRLNRRALLGGSSGLRGTLPEQFVGRNLLLANFEYRTKPFEFQTAYLGFTLFYDVGSAYDATPSFTHTVGIGARLLLPQFNSEVIRFDFGFVLGGPTGLDRFSSSYGQVTDLKTGFLSQPF